MPRKPPPPSQVKFAALAEEIGVRELARRLGVSPGYVTRICQGKKVPAGELLAVIEREHGIPMIGWYHAK